MSKGEAVVITYMMQPQGENFNDNEKLLYKDCLRPRISKEGIKSIEMSRDHSASQLQELYFLKNKHHLSSHFKQCSLFSPKNR